MNEYKKLQLPETWLKSTKKNIREGQHGWALTHYKSYRNLGGKKSFETVVRYSKASKLQRESALSYYKAHKHNFSL